MNARVSHSAPDALNAAQALDQISRQWDGDIVRQLTDYIAIPAKSPMFDAVWAQHGYIDTVVRNAADWVAAQKVEGLTLEVMRLPGRTPVLFFEVPASRGSLPPEGAVLAWGGPARRTSPREAGTSKNSTGVRPSRRMTSSVRPSTFCAATQSAALRTTVSR